MPAAPAFREAQLYVPVRDFLIGLGYTVRGEVKHCDVAAIRPRQDVPGEAAAEELVVVELKKGLTIDLLVQGTKRQRDADLVYLAIPRPAKFWFSRKWRDLLHLLRRLELGLVLVDLTAFGTARPVVEVVLDPVPFDRGRSQTNHKKHRAGLLREIKGRSHDGNTGGSTGVKLMTAYRERALAIAGSLAERGPQSPAQLRTDPADSKTATLLQRNVYGWFERLERGRYTLSPTGQCALVAAENQAPYATTSSRRQSPKNPAPS